MPGDVNIKWNEISHNKWDSPNKIVEGSFVEQRRILSGYKAQVLQGLISEEKYNEALNPNQIAISLSGEPLFYPYLDEFIRFLISKEFSVFLVTSGVLPKNLDFLKNKESEPTRVFISITAPNECLYNTVNRPIKDGLWKNLIKTLEGLNDFHCPTVLRITLIKDVNMDKKFWAEFSDLIKLSSCRNVEVKAYMNVGFSMKRLSERNMPEFDEVKDFSIGISDITGYKLEMESKDSRVILLSK